MLLSNDRIKLSDDNFVMIARKNLPERPDFHQVSVKEFTYICNIIGKKWPKTWTLIEIQKLLEEMPETYTLWERFVRWVKCLKPISKNK